MRKWPLLAAFALLALACGGSAEQAAEPAAAVTAPVESTTAAATAAPSSQPDATEPTAATGETTPMPAAEPEAEAAESGVAIEGPAAPDFTLALGNGGTYTLSQGAKPVYLVFWAEW